MRQTSSWQLLNFTVIFSTRNYIQEFTSKIKENQFLIAFRLPKTLHKEMLEMPRLIGELQITQELQKSSQESHVSQ